MLSRNIAIFLIFILNIFVTTLACYVTYQMAIEDVTRRLSSAESRIVMKYDTKLTDAILQNKLDALKELTETNDRVKEVELKIDSVEFLLNQSLKEIDRITGTGE